MSSSCVLYDAAARSQAARRADVTARRVQRREGEEMWRLPKYVAVNLRDLATHKVSPPSVERLKNNNKLSRKPEELNLDSLENQNYAAKNG